MNRNYWKVYILYVVIVLAVLFTTSHFFGQPQESQIVGGIVNKYEKDGRCFVEVQIEVTPEEYIGYDMGDDYATK